MREIVFKGKTVSTKIWVEGNLFMNSGIPFIGETWGDFFDIDFGMGFEEVIPETVGESTGLEYNFHEYFEHDICEMIIPTKDRKTESIKGIIEYYMGSFFLNELGGKWRKWIFTDVATMAIESRHKIIYLGNSYDNPELLEDIV